MQKDYLLSFVSKFPKKSATCIVVHSLHDWKGIIFFGVLCNTLKIPVLGICSLHSHLYACIWQRQYGKQLILHSRYTLSVHALPRVTLPLTCCDPSPLTLIMCGIMATSPFNSGGGRSSGIWSVIIIVTYIHGELSWTAFL